MADYYSDPIFSMDVPQNSSKEKNRIFIHIGLAIMTFLTTLIAGTEWTTGMTGPFELDHLLVGLPYALSIMFVLGSHEFGHYFAARLHKVKATLPYFIPLPSVPGFFINFGTMGAVIKTKSSVPDNKAMFDIGVAGPVAGFVACLILLIYGFTHLPGQEYILGIHPDYFSPEYGKGGMELKFGDTLLFASLRYLLTNPGQFVPPMSEIYHYPYLCVGWFGLFVTSMNMIPVGQLDGGHIIYSMFGGKKHTIIASVFMIILVSLGITGILDTFFAWGLNIGWSGWLFWALILFFIIKVKHPPVYQFYNLDRKRMILGYFSLFILLVSFSPAPIVLSGGV